MKKALSLFLVLLMVISAMPVFAVSSFAASYNCVDGSSIDPESFAVSVLLFGRPGCGNCRGTIYQIVSSDEIADRIDLDNVRFIFVDIDQNSSATVKEYADEVNSSKLAFCYDETWDANNAMWEYLSEADITSSVTLPVMVYLNQCCDKPIVSTGYQTADEILKNIETITDCSASCSISRLANPAAKVANTTAGVNVSWTKVEGAKGYYVYRKTGTGSYAKIATVTTLSYLDKTAAAGTTYTYAVRAYNGSVLSAFTGVSIVRLANPAAKVANTTAGVKVSWSKVTGAEGYYVYRRTGTAAYSIIAATNELSFVDTEATPGTTYTYAVRALNGSVLSDDTDVSIVRLTNPAVKLANTKDGVKATWAAVTGAKGYYVYRKTGSGSYAKIATITSGTTVSYVDKTAKAGTTYTYAVRAYNGNVQSAYNAVTIIRLANTTAKLANTTAGVKVSWTKVAGAKGYYVYRKTGSGSYAKIATTTALSYVDKTAKAGTKYTYAVRAYNGKTLDAFTAVSIVRLATPTVKLANTKNGVKATWGKVAGAKGYYVYRKTAGGSYSKIATIKSGTTVSYVDKTAKSGAKYSYIIKAYNGSYISAYTAKTITCKK